MTVYVDETLEKTNIQRPNLVLVCTYLVRSKRAKSVTEAFKMLNSGELNIQELEDEIIKSYQRHKEPEPDKLESPEV